MSWLAYSTETKASLAWKAPKEKQDSKYICKTVFRFQIAHVSHALACLLHLPAPHLAVLKKGWQNILINASTAKWLMCFFFKKRGIFAQAYVSNILIFYGLHTCCGSGRGCFRLAFSVLGNLSHSMQTPQKTCETTAWKPGSFWCLALIALRDLLCSGGHGIIFLLCWLL